MSFGVEVSTRTAPPARGAPTEIDTLFLAYKSGTGDLTRALEIRDLAAFEAESGVRTTGASGNALAYDVLDTFFREGGRRAVIGRYTTEVNNALALFTANFGHGQVAAPYETPGTTAWTKLRAHAVNMRRFALYDVALADDTAAELTTAGGGLIDNDEYGMCVGPWANIPAPAGTIGGGSRQVPASAAVAALIARADALGNPNRAAAGRDFPLQYVDSFVYTPTDDELSNLLNAGVNLFVDRFGVLQLEGFQTNLAQNVDNPFWQANASRARMWLVARAESLGQTYRFKPITVSLLRKLTHDLDSLCLELWGVDGLYGETAAEAFATDASATINSDSSVAQGDIHAVVEAKFSMHTKRVLIDLVSIPITGRVSAQ
jgi:hypothetical protein